MLKTLRCPCFAEAMTSNDARVRRELPEFHFEMNRASVFTAMYSHLQWTPFIISWCYEFFPWDYDVENEPKADENHLPSNFENGIQNFSWSVPGFFCDNFEKAEHRFGLQDNSIYYLLSIMGGAYCSQFNKNIYM